MSTTPPHSRILNKAAQEILAPEGVFQQGRSRCWIDDHGWWIVNIEFQPSSFSKGSYLNVGAMWLWHEKNYFSFDTTSRIRPWIDYVDDQRFDLEARNLAHLALREVLALRQQFPSIARAAHYLHKELKRLPDNPWTMLHAAVSSGCIGKIREARACFEMIGAFKAEYDWHNRLKDAARRYALVLDDNTAFLQCVRETIRRTRTLLKLPERDSFGL